LHLFLAAFLRVLFRIGFSHRHSVLGVEGDCSGGEIARNNNYGHYSTTYDSFKSYDEILSFAIDLKPAGKDSIIVEE
jgi:hypothetical protein